MINNDIQVLGELSYCDLRASGQEHITFNAAMLTIIQQAGCSKIYVAAEAEHSNTLSSILSNVLNIEFNSFSLPTYSKSKIKTIFFREILGIFRILKTLLLSRIYSRPTVYSFASPFLSYVIVMLSRFTATKSIVFVHGELERLLDRNFSIYHNFLLRALQAAEKNKLVKFIVLGQGIQERAVNKLHANFNIGFINHPCFEYDFIDGKRELGCIGRVGAERSDKVTMTADSFIKQLNSSLQGSFKLLQIGKNSLSGKYLDFTEYRREILRSDFFIFLYREDGYKVTASGALLDAVSTSRPVYCLPFGYALDIANSFSNLIICDNIAEMITKIGERNTYIDGSKVSNQVAQWNCSIINDFRVKYREIA